MAFGHKHVMRRRASHVIAASRMMHHTCFLAASRWSSERRKAREPGAMYPFLAMISETGRHGPAWLALRFAPLALLARSAGRAHREALASASAHLSRGR